jgi:hypothetical protein
LRVEAARRYRMHVRRHGGAPAARSRLRHPCRIANSAERLCPAEGTSGRRPLPAAFQFSNRVSDNPAITAFTLPGWRWGLREPVVFSRCLATYREPKRPLYRGINRAARSRSNLYYSKLLQPLSTHCTIIQTVALRSRRRFRRCGYNAALRNTTFGPAPAGLFRSRFAFLHECPSRAGSCTESIAQSCA